MATVDFTESVIEQACLAWLEGLGYKILFGPSISPEAPDIPGTERDAYQDVVLASRLQEVLFRLNPTLPPIVLEEAFRQLIHINQPSLLLGNHAFHQYLI